MTFGRAAAQDGEDGEMKIKRRGNVTEADIRELEERWHVTLPQDYRAFLMNTNGGLTDVLDDDSNGGSIYIEDFSDSIALNVLYGVKTGKKNADINTWMEMFKDEIFPQTLLIGDDLTSGFIALICGGEDAGVYFWDDSYVFKGSCDEHNVYFIADSFTELLKMAHFEGIEEPAAK